MIAAVCTTEAKKYVGGRGRAEEQVNAVF